MKLWLKQCSGCFLLYLLWLAVDLYLVTGQHLSFQSFCMHSLKLLLWYKRLHLTVHVIRLFRDCTVMYYWKPSGPRLWAQTYRVAGLANSEASRRPPQLLCSEPFYNFRRKNRLEDSNRGFIYLLLTNSGERKQFTIFPSVICFG